MNYKKYIAGVVAFAAVASMAIAMPAFAQSSGGNPPMWSHGRPGDNEGMGMSRPAVFGTVTSVSGTTLTVSAKQGFGSTTPTVTFTVDASNATVRKGQATTTVSAIAVNDMIAIQGTVSGTNVTATSIFDGIMPHNRVGGPKNGNKKGFNHASSTPTSTFPITGDGQPIVAGTVSAVSGSSITIVNKSNVTYTVDASNAKIVQGQNTVSISSITVGDGVLVQGAINGTSVTASSVIDQTKPANSNKGHAGFLGGMGFGGIGQFFMHIFGF